MNKPNSVDRASDHAVVMRTLTQQDKFQIAYRDDFTCQFCGARPGNDDIEVEHLIPVSKGGSDNDENLVAACRKCNRNKSDLVAFPKSMCEGPDRRAPDWIVHKSFGEWEIKFHPTSKECLPVLEYAPYGYWFETTRAHEPDWLTHVLQKRWPEPHKDEDFIEALAYFRRLTRSA